MNPILPTNNPATAGFPISSGQHIAAQGGASFSNLAYLFLLGFVFVASSRVLDFAAPPGLHLPLILALISAFLTFSSNGVFAAFSTPTGKLMGLYGIWFILCVPFSQWKGESVEILTEELSRSFLIFMMVAITVNTFQRVKGMIAVIGVSVIVTMIIALSANQRIEGRLTMSAGQYANPNDLAQIMLVGMCFLPMLGVWLKNRFFTYFSVMMMFPFLYTVLLTGSRAGLVVAGALGVIVIMLASPGKRLALLLLLPLLALSALSFSPTARERIGTLFGDDAPNSRDEELAASSSLARRLALEQSLQLTLENPIFGVGPGVFQSASAHMGKAAGMRALWVETHNSYTQVSSETGIPGAIFFCSAILMSLRDLLRIRKQTKNNPRLKQVHDTSFYLLLGFSAFALTSLFSSVAYGFLFWMLFGLCAATISTLKRELAVPTPTITTPYPLTPAIPPTTPLPAESRTTRVTLSGRIKPTRKSSGNTHLLQ